MPPEFSPPPIGQAWAEDSRALGPSARGLAWAGFSGFLMAWAFPGPALQPLAYLALVPFCLQLFQARGLRRILGLFAAYAGAFHLCLLLWLLAMHPLMWLGFSWWGSVGVVLFAWLAVSLALSLQLLAVGVVYALATRRCQGAGPYQVLLLACAWVVMEWLASLGMFGFTWTNLALTQVALLPAVQGLDLVGPYPLAGLVVGLNGCLALGWLKGWQNHPWRRLSGAFALLWLLWLGYGLVRLKDLEAGMALAPKFPVGIVQGNLHGAEKFDLSEAGLKRSTLSHLALGDRLATAALVVWPETAVPTFLRRAPALQALLAADAQKHQRHLFVGTQDWTGAEATHDLSFQNSVALIRPDGSLAGFDHKRHLVPYGEFVPWRAYTPDFLARINNLAYDFTAGSGAKVFDTPLGKLGAGVCYDGIFPEAMRPPMEQGAELLCLVTNDAWYKDTSAPRVLSAHAQLRAIESRRYLIRAANTGISSVIEPTGRLQAQTPTYVATVLSGEVSPRSGLSPYLRHGEWLAQLLGALILLATLWGGPRQKGLGDGGLVA